MCTAGIDLRLDVGWPIEAEMANECLGATSQKDEVPVAIRFQKRVDFTRVIILYIHIVTARALQCITVYSTEYSHLI